MVLDFEKENRMDGVTAQLKGELSGYAMENVLV